MGKSVKVGGNFLNNLKFDVKDPSMWLNIVIVLLIVVVFILLAVQVFTPRRDVIDGFVTIPITNKNLPWPFNDNKFDPLYYDLVFSGKTKNGSADGEGEIYFSKSFMPLNKDNMPGVKDGAGLDGNDGKAQDLDGTAKYNAGKRPSSGIVVRVVDINSASWKNQASRAADEKEGKKEPLYQLNLGTGDKTLLRDVLISGKLKYKGQPLTIWKNTGTTGFRTGYGTNLFLPLTLFKEYLQIVRDTKKLPGVTAAEAKKVKTLVSENNYDNLIVQPTSEDSLVLFTGTWKEGKLTKAVIKDCARLVDPKTTDPDFTLFYNNKEQLEDPQSVEYAVQFLRTPLYTTCMGA